MTSHVNDDVVRVMQSIRDDFPRRKREAEALLRTLGLSEELEMRIQPPGVATSLPTFDSNVRRELTPMLRARFGYAGKWDTAHRIWLGVDDIGEAMQSGEVLLYHDALRDNWADSAPMRFPDDKLTLFGITDGVPENLIYLVWTNENAEPNVWVYEGMTEQKFESVLDYLIFIRDRK